MRDPQKEDQFQGIQLGGVVQLNVLCKATQKALQRDLKLSLGDFCEGFYKGAQPLFVILFLILFLK